MKTVDKAMFLLRQFSLENLEIGLNDLARATDQDKAVTRRLLLSLIKHGFIEQNPETRKYRLGHAFLSLARLREATVPMVKATQVVTQWLSAQANETVHVGIPGAVGLGTASFTLPARGNVINLQPAETYPYHSSSSGLAFLAFCSEDTRERLLKLKREKLTRFTVTDEAELREILRETRSRGFSCARNTVEIGVASVAMPFFTDGKDPAGTIAIAVPDLNLDAARQAELAALLGAAIRQLETALTGAPSSRSPASLAVQ
ncbi:IclR family transcriptional regulator [Leisingera sp. SS27]|uniref:IclR family transcriptional regulator n=1 Tax=Leisingera sp. SS27 TaxID=2979462 RepID=UPI00232DC1F9|nr:IclR family transcriptional regulator [Leisingera sp. SS27]MDC0659031.1 IclR family transcriptional regulator [Leisingera sp. SS27]